MLHLFSRACIFSATGARLLEAVVDRYLKCCQVYGHVKYVSDVAFIVAPSIVSGYLGVIED